MRNTLLINPNATHYVASIKSAISLLAYHCIVAMRVLSPYLFAANIVVLAPHVRPADAEVIQQHIYGVYAVLSEAVRSPAKHASKFPGLVTTLPAL